MIFFYKESKSTHFFFFFFFLGGGGGGGGGGEMEGVVCREGSVARISEFFIQIIKI